MNMCFRAGRTDGKALTPDAPRSENLVSPGAQLSHKAASEDGQKRSVSSFVREDSGAGTGARAGPGWGTLGGPGEREEGRAVASGTMARQPRWLLARGATKERRDGGHRVREAPAPRRLRSRVIRLPLVMPGVWSAQMLSTHPGHAVWLGVGVKGALSRQNLHRRPHMRTRSKACLSGAERRKWWLGLAFRTDGQVDRNTTYGQGLGPSQAAPALPPASSGPLSWAQGVLASTPRGHPPWA